MRITPVRNRFSDEVALFPLSLSLKLKCIKLKQYHLDPIYFNSIYLTKSLCCIIQF